MLRAQVENQLTIYRPDAIGVLRDVADQQWPQDARIIPDQPSKGIKRAWARARRAQGGQWKNGVPPEPDYSRLDASPWLHGPNQEVMDQMRALEDQEFVQDLDKEEAWNCRHPDAKYVDIDIPDHLLAKALRMNRGRGKRCSQKHKWAQPGWQAKLQAK